MATVADLKQELARLSDGDRAELASFLITSLDGNSDEREPAEFDTELRRREQEVIAGTAQGTPAGEAMRHLTRKYREASDHS